MLNINEAEKMVEIILENKSKEINIKLAIMKDETIEFYFGWMFFYQSAAFVYNNDETKLIGGNAPLIVDKFNGSYHVTGTGKSEEFYISKYCQHRNNIDKFYNEI